MMIVYVEIASQKRSKFTLKESKNWTFMRRLMLIFGFSVRDVKDPCMRIFCALVEIVQSSIEDLKQRRILRRIRKF